MAYLSSATPSGSHDEPPAATAKPHVVVASLRCGHLLDDPRWLQGVRFLGNVCDCTSAFEFGARAGAIGKHYTAGGDGTTGNANSDRVTT
jgi:hypothetical protein